MNEVYIAEFSDTTGAVVEKFFSSYDAAVKWARAKAKGSDDLSEESYVAKDGTEITEVSWSKKYSGFLVAQDREIGYTVTIRKAMPFEVPEEFADRHAAAASLGRAGGQVKTAAKATASRENGKLGGRPKTHVEECFCSNRSGSGSVRGYFRRSSATIGQLFVVSRREAATITRAFGVDEEDLCEVYVYDDAGERAHLTSSSAD